MNSEAVIACINESCKSWHDNNLSLLAAALLLRHFYVPNTDGPEPPADSSESTLQIQQDNSSVSPLAGVTTTTSTTTSIVHDNSVNGVINGVPTTEVIRTIPTANNTPTINNLITPNSSLNFPPANASPTDKPNKNSTISALIHATTNTTMEDPPKTPTTPSSGKQCVATFPSTPSGSSTPILSSTPSTPIDTLNTPTDTIHHPELITVPQDPSTPTAPEFIPVNATVPTRHVKECGHNIICILQKNNFSLSTSKKVSAASQQVYVNHVYPPIDASKTVLEMIAIVKEFWKLQMAPSPLSFCGLVTYMKNLTTPPQEPSVNMYNNPVAIYPMSLCPPSPVVTQQRRKRTKTEPGTNGTPQQQPSPQHPSLSLPSTPTSDPTLLAHQIITCSEQNKSLISRLSSLESDIKTIHQICLQQECELKNMGHTCLIKGALQGETELKIASPWPYGEKVVSVNQTLWQASLSLHSPPSYWFREEQHIIEIINNDKEGDLIYGYHVAQDILLMKVDLEWLKKSFDHPSRKPDETMQHLELAYNRFDGYCADSGEIGLFPRGFAKIARKMTLHRKFN